MLESEVLYLHKCIWIYEKGDLMSEKHRRYFLKERETKALLAQISAKLGVKGEQILKGKIKLEIAETDFGELYLINGKPQLAKIGETTFPTLVFDEFLAVAPKAVVDMGAVPYICKGANVMAPGIMRYEGEFKKGNLIVIVDERNRKALAIGETLYESKEVKEIKQGVTIKNLHYVGDKIWNLVKSSFVRT